MTRVWLPPHATSKWVQVAFCEYPEASSSAERQTRCGAAQQSNPSLNPWRKRPISGLVGKNRALWPARTGQNRTLWPQCHLLLRQKKAYYFENKPTTR